MKPEKKIVISAPLHELWDSSGPVDGQLAECLDECDIKGLLEGGATFVVADVGHPFQWISPQKRLWFFEHEVKPRLWREGLMLEDYPGQYSYVARKWLSPSRGVIIVLDVHH